MKADAYQVITDRIVGLLEQGTVPCQKPWQGEPGNGGRRMNTRSLRIEATGDFFYRKITPRIRLAGQWLGRGSKASEREKGDRKGTDKIILMRVANDRTRGLPLI